MAYNGLVMNGFSNLAFVLGNQNLNGRFLEMQLQNSI